MTKRGCRTITVLAAAFFFGGTLVGAGENAEIRLFEFKEPAMGTIFSIRIYGTDPIEAEAAAQAAYQRVHQLNSIFSDYDPESELLRFCRGPVGVATRLTPELHEILRLSWDLAHQTEGRFDPTIGPLVRLWRQSHRLGRLPTPEKLEEAFSRTGYQFLKINDDGTASLEVEGMRLDLGGIAKGYAADEALAILRERGFPQSLVAASGDLAIGEAPPKKRGWTVGLSSVASPHEPDRFLVVRNCGISTSGDTQQFVILGGKRYSHIVDPATGLGLTDRKSVSVLAPNATTSDSMATALSVMGANSGPLAEGVIARFVELDDGGEIREICHGQLKDKTWESLQAAPVN